MIPMDNSIEKVLMARAIGRRGIAGHPYPPLFFSWLSAPAFMPSATTFLILRPLPPAQRFKLQLTRMLQNRNMRTLYFEVWN